MMEEHNINIGNIYRNFHNPRERFVIAEIHPELIVVENVSHRNPVSNRWGILKRDFDNVYSHIDYVGYMNKATLSTYLSLPEKTILEGVFLARKDVINMDFKQFADEGEIIKINHVNIEENILGVKCGIFQIKYLRFGLPEEKELIYSYRTKELCYLKFWELFKRLQ